MVLALSSFIPTKGGNRSLRSMFIESGSISSQTIEINRKIETKRNLSNSLGISFIIIELVVLALVFLLLYQYRTAHEFQMDFQLFQWYAPRFQQYAVFFICFSCFYLYFTYKFKIFHFRASSGLMDELYKTFQAHS